MGVASCVLLAACVAGFGAGVGPGGSPALDAYLASASHLSDAERDRMRRHLPFEGMTLEEVVATVCGNPAAMLGMSGELGTLAPGRAADISVLEMLTGRFVLSDNSGVEMVAEQLLQPRFCLMGGRRFDADSPLVPPPLEAAA